MGLLDLLNNDQARFGIGLLAAAGPRSATVGTGDRMQEALGTMDAFKQQQLRQQMLQQQMQSMGTTNTLQQAQVEKAMRELAQQQFMEDAAKRFYQPASPGVGANMPAIESALPPEMRTGLPNMTSVPARPASFDMNGYMGEIMSKYPLAGLKMQRDAAAADEVKLGPDESIFSRSTGKPKYQGAGKLTDDMREYNSALNQGFKGTLQDWILAQKQAGAPRVDVRNDISTGKSLADQIGPIVAASQGAAMGAVNQMATINRLNASINSGKLIAGPGTDIRVYLAQLGEVSGLGGKDNAETLANTRGAIQDLAKFSLDGRSALKGQGQISDYEGKLLAKATSGDLNTLTIPEIKVLADVASRVAKAQYDLHQQHLKTMRSRPNMKDMADFYDVPPLPANGPASVGNVVDFGSLK